MGAANNDCLIETVLCVKDISGVYKQENWLSCAKHNMVFMLHSELTHLQNLLKLMLKNIMFVCVCVCVHACIYVCVKDRKIFYFCQSDHFIMRWREHLFSSSSCFPCSFHS